MMSKKARFNLLVLLGSVSVVLLSIGFALYFNRSAAIKETDIGASEPGPVKTEPLAAAGARGGGPSVRCSEKYYLTLLREKSVEYQIPEPTLEELSVPLRGGVEFQGDRVLKTKRDVLETPHLRITAAVEKVGEIGEGQGFRAEHIVLQITNQSDAPVAYKVDTRLSAGARCGAKVAIAHNAVVLAPRETVRRTECIFNPRLKLAVRRVEVYEVTLLGHRFLSRLAPGQGGPFDMRVAAGHTFAGLRQCRTVPWRDREAAPAWHAIIDFHARHDCEEYSFPQGYQALTKPQPLPICLETGAR